MTDKEKIQEAANAQYPYINGETAHNVRMLELREAFIKGANYHPLVDITPDAMRERVRNAGGELELLQLSTAIMVNAPKYKPEVCTTLANEIHTRAIQLAAMTIDKIKGGQ